MRQFVRYFLNYLVNILPIGTLNFEILKLEPLLQLKIKIAVKINKKIFFIVSP